ncbi:hypothetical protein NXY56_002328 [Leishmania guyanensis]
MPGFHDSRSPLTTSTVVTAGGAFAAVSPFSSSIEAIRAELHDVVRNIDAVMGAAQRAPSPITSRYCAAGASVSSPRAYRCGVENQDGGRRLHGSPTSCAAALALLRSRRESALPSSAELGPSSIYQPRPTPRADELGNGLPTSSLSAAMPVTTSLSSEGASTASAASETGTVLSATYAAALDYWRVSGRYTFRPMPKGQAELTAAPEAGAALKSAAASTPLEAPGADVHKAHAAASITYAPPAPLPYWKEQGATTSASFAGRAHTDTGILADTSVAAVPLSGALPAAASKATAPVHQGATFASPPWSPRVTLPVSCAAPTSSATASELLAPDCSRALQKSPPRTLVDDSHFPTTAPIPLPAPSSVTTLSARLAALRAADMAQRGSLLKQQKQREEWLHEEKRHVFSGLLASVAQDSALLTDDGLSAHRGSKMSSGKYFSTSGASVAHQQNVADSPGLQQSSVAVSRSATNATSDPSWLVCSPSPKRATSQTARTRQTQRVSRQQETSLIVSLAQQLQATREEVWRDVQDSVKRETPARQPPLPPPKTSGMASYTPPRLPEHHGRGIGDKSPFVFTTNTNRRSAAAVTTVSSQALSASAAPFDALQAQLSPSALTMATASGDVGAAESLAMDEELAMRERIAARRQRRSENVRAVHDRAAEHQKRYYERLSETRDRELAEHLRGEVARQTAVQAAAEARVAQVRAALPDQPELVTSDELFAIRLHAQQLERLREQVRQVVGQSPSSRVGTTSVPLVDELSATSPSSLSIPVIATSKSCNTAAPQREHIKEGVAPTVQQECNAADAQGDRQNPPAGIVAAAASAHANYSKVAIDPNTAGGEGCRSAGAPSASTQIPVCAAQEATPEHALLAHRVRPSSSAQDLAQKHAAELCQSRRATPAHHNRREVGKAVHEIVDGSVGGSLDEDWVTSTQLPPPFADGQVKAGLQAKTPSPSPVRPQSAAPSRLTSRADALDTEGLIQAMPAKSTVSTLANVAPSPTRSSHALAVSENDDAERDMLSSPPSGGYGDCGENETGSKPPDRTLSIQFTHLHVSPRRGTAWKDDSTVSDTSSSSSAWVPAPMLSLRASRSTSRTESCARLPASRTRSPLCNSRGSQSSSVPPRRAGAVSTGSSVLTSPRAITHSALLSKVADPLQTHRRAVQHEMDKRTVLRAQAALSKHGVVVDVQLAGRRVPSLVKLSKDGTELLFYLDRVEQVPLQTPCTSPQRSLPASSVRFAPLSPSSAAAVSHVPEGGNAPGMVSRAPQVSSSSSPTAARPPRFHPPWIPGAATPVASSMQPYKALVKMPPAGTLVKRKATAGRGGGAIAAPPRGFVQSSSQPQQQRLVATAPPQSGGAAPLPSPSPLRSQRAAPLLLRRDTSQSTASATRLMHVRELHHFPWAYSRVYVPFGVMGYERDLGLGGPRTWEDVRGVLCGPASFEVLRRYRCPLFAEVRGPLCAPYRVYVIIPEFKRIDVPQDAVLLVLDFQQRIDWVLFLLAMQRDVLDRGDSGNGGDGDVLTPRSNLNGNAARSPVLSYGRALWMLAAQRLQRARALQGMNPFDFERMWHTRPPAQHGSRRADGSSACGAPSMGTSSLAKGAAYSLAGGAAPTGRFAALPSTYRGHDRGARSNVRPSSTVFTSVPAGGRNDSLARRRDPGLGLGWEVPLATEVVGRRNHRGGGSFSRNSRQRTSSARPQASSTSRAGATVAPVTPQETSKPRFQLLKRVTRSLGVRSSRKGD